MVEQSHDLADPPARHRRITTPEQTGIDELVAIEKRDESWPLLIDVLAHILGPIGEQDERFAGGATLERVPQSDIEDGSLYRCLLAARTVQMRDQVDAGPVRVDVRGTRRIRDRGVQTHAHGR